MTDEGSTASSVRLHLSFPEELVDRPLVYEIVKGFDVVPNIRRADVEADSAWVILELAGSRDQLAGAIRYLEDLGCVVNTMEGDVVEG
ncbi:MAG: FeS-binding protein [Acidimicrobiia bacterium]|nr:FeS-binding protein [Acidimicrobiia bacterium]